MTKKNKRRSDWGKGWDGRSRVPDETYKNNYNQIDWSSTNKKDKKNNDGMEKSLEENFK
jgi:hypothetical protein